MRPVLGISGIGCVRSIDHEASEVEARLRAALRPASAPVRFIHRIEEMAFLAAHEALTRAGVSTPVSSEDIGLALGVEEGIDGIKARYFEGVLREGPLGASPMVFPLTTPNTIAARIAILLDLRGESFTVGGGGLSGAHAVGLAVQALRDGQTRAMLAGGTTAVEQEFLDAWRQSSRGQGGELGCAACLFLLERHDGGNAAPTAGGLFAGPPSPFPSPPMGARDDQQFPSPLGGERARVRGLVRRRWADTHGQLLGYAEGFGKTDLLDAIQACLDDAELLPTAVASVRTASVHDWREAAEAIRRAGITAPAVRSSSAGLQSAAFPLAMAEAVSQTAPSPPPGGPGTRRGEGGVRGVTLVLGSDCLAGAAAAIVRGGA